MPTNARTAAAAALACVVGVTFFILILDITFRQSLPQSYVARFTSPLLPRMLLACVGSALEEVKFRLLVMTLIVAAIQWWRGRVSAPAMVIAILLAQLANVGSLVITDPLYATMRYWAVGSVWGWLYWRHGWLAALAGHASAHLLLDPLLYMVLS